MNRAKRAEAKLILMCSAIEGSARWGVSAYDAESVATHASDISDACLERLTAAGLFDDDEEQGGAEAKPDTPPAQGEHGAEVAPETKPAQGETGAS